MFEQGRKFLEQHFTDIHAEYNHMDLFGFSLNGHCCEIEVKTADYDLRKEIYKEAKVFKHNSYRENRNSGFCPNKFFFLIPEGLIKNGVPFIEKNFFEYGVITFNQFTKEIKVLKQAHILHERPFSGELLDYKIKDRKHKFKGKI